MNTGSTKNWSRSKQKMPSAGHAKTEVEKTAKSIKSWVPVLALPLTGYVILSKSIGPL